METPETEVNAMKRRLERGKKRWCQARAQTEAYLGSSISPQFFEGDTAAGNLNPSQSYRDWGLAEIEGNHDFYGNARFDDIAFQLSPEGQALQGKIIESYAEQLRDGIEDRLVLPPRQPFSRPSISAPGSVRGRAHIGGGDQGTVPTCKWQSTDRQAAMLSDLPMRSGSDDPKVVSAWRREAAIKLFGRKAPQKESDPNWTNGGPHWSASRMRASCGALSCDDTKQIAPITGQHIRFQHA